MAILNERAVNIDEYNDVWTSYPVRVTVDKETGKFSILNLGNFGYGYFRENKFEIAGTIDFSAPVEGSVDNYPGYKATFDPEQYAKSEVLEYYPVITNTYWTALTSANFRLQRLMILPDDPTKVDPLMSHPDPGPDETDMFGGVYYPMKLAHNSVVNSWVTNDGERRTYEDFMMDIEPRTYYCPVTFCEVPCIEDPARYTRIQGPNDVTNDVTLNLGNIFYSPQYKQIMVAGEMETSKNHQYVDHYELHMVKGSYKSVNDNGFEYEAEKGHTSAYNIHNYNIELHQPVTQVSTRAASDVRAHDYRFSKTIPSAEIGNVDLNTPMTFYIKTIYTPESGLEPTFHSMQTTTPTLPTGIENVEFDSDNFVEYYDMTGLRVAEPVKGQIYLRRQGTQTTKVIY